MTDDGRHDEDERDDAHDESDEDARAILARRRTFVLSALAGLTLTGASECRNPFMPCLEPARVEDAYAPPRACLQVVAPPPDAGGPIPVACLSPMMPPTGGTGGTTPMPCLSTAPVPHACLRVAAPPSARPPSVAPKPQPTADSVPDDDDGEARG